MNGSPRTHHTAAPNSSDFANNAATRVDSGRREFAKSSTCPAKLMFE